MWMTRIGQRAEYTDACAPGGDGQCDGYGPDSEVCDCGCHTLWEPLHTTEQYAQWHRDLWATYEPTNPYRPVQISTDPV